MRLREVKCFKCKQRFASKTALKVTMLANGSKHLLCSHCQVKIKKESK